MTRYLIEFRDGNFDVIKAGSAALYHGEWMFTGVVPDGVLFFLDASTLPDDAEPSDSDILFVERLGDRVDIRVEWEAQMALALHRGRGAGAS